MELPQIPNMAELIAIPEASAVKIGKLFNEVFLQHNYCNISKKLQH
jgi:hypothetical protein